MLKSTIIYWQTVGWTTNSLLKKCWFRDWEPVEKKRVWVFHFFLYRFQHGFQQFSNTRKEGNVDKSHFFGKIERRDRQTERSLLFRTFSFRPVVCVVGRSEQRDAACHPPRSRICRVLFFRPLQSRRGRLCLFSSGIRSACTTIWIIVYFKRFQLPNSV